MTICSPVAGTVPSSCLEYTSTPGLLSQDQGGEQNSRIAKYMSSEAKQPGFNSLPDILPSPLGVSIYKFRITDYCEDVMS